MARLFVRAFLQDAPVVDDAELIVSELATNAVRHTSSGVGGEFRLTVARTPDSVWIEVTDHGSPGAPALSPAEEEDESGRGLVIVNALATRWGHRGLSGAFITAYAELDLAAAVVDRPPGPVDPPRSPARTGAEPAPLGTEARP